MQGTIADRQLRAWLAVLDRYSEPDVAQLRAAAEDRGRSRSAGPAMAAVSDLDAAGVPVRLYVPADQPTAVIVYLHGGGWTIGSLTTHDGLCRRLAATAQARVVAVDYRLAPEHPWPAAIDDAAAVLEWVTAAAPAASSVALAGDSAGGAVTALLCQRLRDEAPELLPDLQVLICANTDLAGDQPSMTDKGRGWGLDREMVEFFNRQWVPDPARWTDPVVSPLRAADLSGLPEAIVVTAEHDPLRDQGEAYAEGLRAAGVRVTARREPGLVHNYVTLGDISPACAAATERLFAEIGVALRR